MCKFGPKCLLACDDLAAHHGDEVMNPRNGEVTRINNGCTNCRWFGRHISMWEPWDGTVPPLDSGADAAGGGAGDGASGGASVSVPPTQAQETLVGMGYTLEATRQGYVLRAMRRARRRRHGSLEAEVEAGISALEGEDDDDDDYERLGDDNEEEEEEEEEEQEESRPPSGPRPVAGDRVRITAASDPATRPYVGQTGVLRRDDDSDRPFQARFDDGQSW